MNKRYFVFLVAAIVFNISAMKKLGGKEKARAMSASDDESERTQARDRRILRETVRAQQRELPRRQRDLGQKIRDEMISVEQARQAVQAAGNNFNVRRQANRLLANARNRLARALNTQAHQAVLGLHKVPNLDVGMIIREYLHFDPVLYAFLANKIGTVAQFITDDVHHGGSLSKDGNKYFYIQPNCIAQPCMGVVLNISTNQRVNIPGAIKGALSDDGSKLLVIKAHEGQLKLVLLNLERNQVVREWDKIDPHYNPENKLSADGSRILLTDLENKISGIYDTRSGDALLVRQLRVQSDKCALSLNGEYCVLTGSDHVAQLVRIKTSYEPEIEIKTYANVLSAQFDRQTNKLFVIFVNREAELFDLASGNPVDSWRPNYRSSHGFVSTWDLSLNSALFSADGTKLILQDFRNYLYLIDIATGTEIDSWGLHSNAQAYSAGGNLFTMQLGNKMNLMNVHTGREVAYWNKSDGSILSANGRTLIYAFDQPRVNRTLFQTNKRVIDLALVNRVLSQINTMAQYDLLEAFAVAIKGLRTPLEARYGRRSGQIGRIHATEDQYRAYVSLPLVLQEALRDYFYYPNPSVMVSGTGMLLQDISPGAYQAGQKIIKNKKARERRALEIMRRRQEQKEEREERSPKKKRRKK